MLDGGDNLGLSLAQVEAMQRANKALLTGDGAAVLAAAATVSRERKQALAKPDALMLPELIDKWAAEKQPKARSVDMWRRTCAMFYAVNGEKPLGAIAKADVLVFKTRLIAEGKAPATVDSRLSSPAVTGPVRRRKRHHRHGPRRQREGPARQASEGGSASL